MKHTAKAVTDEGNAPRMTEAEAAQRLSDAQELYPPTHLEIAKRKLTLDLVRAQDKARVAAEFDKLGDKLETAARAAVAQNDKE
jgi:hypothetical protein